MIILLVNYFFYVFIKLELIGFLELIIMMKIKDNFNRFKYFGKNIVLIVKC